MICRIIATNDWLCWFGGNASIIVCIVSKIFYVYEWYKYFSQKVHSYCRTEAIQVNMFLLMLLYSLVLEGVRLVSSTDSKIDPAECQIWGPGVFPDQIVMPARYFYIQAVDNYKHKYVVPYIHDRGIFSVENPYRPKPVAYCL